MFLTKFTSGVASALRFMLPGGSFLGLFLHVASAQVTDDAARGETVSWAIAAPSGAVKPGSRIALTLEGTVLEGWHVYALKQLPAGPTPLKVSLDKSEAVMAAGVITASTPVKVHDWGFDLDVEYYSHAFTLSVPLRIGAKLADGPQQIPVSVRFQTCNDRICQPPKTAHLSAFVNVRTNG